MNVRIAVGARPLRLVLAGAAALTLAVAMAVVAAPAASAAPVGTFQTLASSPQAMTSVTVDPTTGMVYAQGYANTTWYSYNPVTDAWTQLASSPISAGNDGGAAYLNGEIYTVYPEDPSDLGVYDIATDTWKMIPNPLGIGTGNITTAGDLLYLAEGTSFVSYNPATMTTTNLADAPGFTGTSSTVGAPCGDGFNRWGSLASYNGKIYGTQGNSCNGFAVYDIATDTWTQLANAPSDVVLGGAIDSVTGTFYAYGGYSGVSASSDNWYEYDIAAGTWTTATFPFGDINDGGMAYIETPGLQGVYAVEGEQGTGFTRFVTPPPSSSLSISKTASVSKVSLGNTFSYSIKVTNGGPDTAYSTSVSDPLPSDVSFVSASSTAGSCLGTTTVMCKLGDLADGASATITITVKAKTIGTSTNTATVSTTSTDTNSSDNSTVSIPITQAKANLTLAKTANVVRSTVGGPITYTLKASNAGPDTAFGVVITDPLPSDVSFVSDSTTAGTCTGTTTVICNVGDIANGKSATVTINVKAKAAGSSVNTATVTTTSINTASSNSSVAGILIASATKSLRLSVSPGSVVAGTAKCFAFKATSGGKGVKGVSVKFAGKKSHTSSKGKAQICVTLHKKGTYRASASKHGYATTHAKVQVKPKAAKKPVVFTG